MMQKLINWLRGWGKYLLKMVLPYVGGLCGVALLSFVFTGGFSFTQLSERIFWVGLVIFLIAGMVALSHMVSGRAIMFPYNIRKPEDVKKFTEDIPAARVLAEKRFDVGIQLWLIGLGCLAVSALVQTWLG